MTGAKIIALGISSIFLLGIFQDAQAQTYQDTRLSVNGIEVPVGMGNPELSTIPVGQVYGTIRISEPETVSCNLENCVSSIETDKTFGGWIAKVSGTMGNLTSEIQLVNSEGSITYTIILLPEQKQIVTPEIQSTSLLPTWIGNYASYIVGTIIVGVILAISISIVKHKSRQNSRWRTN